MDLSYQQEGRTAMLKERVKRCVCKYCGRHLSLRRITFSDLDDARIEIFCRHCERIEFGVEPEIYQSACYYAAEMGFDYYPDLDDNEATKRMNIAKLCDIISWAGKNFGFLDKAGFTEPPRINPHILGQCVILDDDDLQDMEELVLGTVSTQNDEVR